MKDAHSEYRGHSVKANVAGICDGDVEVPSLPPRSTPTILDFEIAAVLCPIVHQSYYLHSMIKIIADERAGINDSGAIEKHISVSCEHGGGEGISV
jgi:hypothetical protein